jgi:DNA-binding NarL/FixJ family response regulator
MSEVSKILLVDDQHDNLVEYENILKKRLPNYHICSADGSARAIELCKKERFDVLVTDVRMPGMNGDKMFAEIKKFLPDIRCIVITGFPGQDAPVNFLRLGAHDILFKAEFHPQTLVRSVENQAHIVELRNHAEELQQQLAAFHKAIQEIMGTVQSVAQLSRAPDLMQSLRDFTEMAAVLSDAPVAAIFLPEPKGGALEVRCVVGADAPFPSIPLGLGFAGRTAQSGCVGAYARTSEGTWPGDEVSSSIEAGRQSVLSVPLVAQNVCIGVLEVFDKKRFEQRDVEILTRLGVIGATALDLFNATQVADSLLLRALKLATDARQGGSAQSADVAKQALEGMTETIREIDLVGSGERASVIVEQIRRISEFGPTAEEYAGKILTDLLGLLRAQHEAIPEITIKDAMVP